MKGGLSKPVCARPDPSSDTSSEACVRVFLSTLVSHTQYVGVWEVCLAQLRFRPLAKTLACCINLPLTEWFFCREMFACNIWLPVVTQLIH